jgi:hypothetical protein
MKHYLRGRYAIVEGDVQTVRRHKFDSDVLKCPLLHWHVMHILKLAMTDVWMTNVRMHRTVLSPTNCGAIRLQYMRACVSTCCDVEHEISQTPTSQSDVSSSTGCANFTVKSVCVF